MFATIHYKQGLLLEYLFNDQYLHLMDKLFCQSKKMLAPYLVDVIEKSNRELIFNVSYPQGDINCILTVIQCYA